MSCLSLLCVFIAVGDVHTLWWNSSSLYMGKNWRKNGRGLNDCLHSWCSYTMPENKAIGGYFYTGATNTSVKRLLNFALPV